MQRFEKNDINLNFTPQKGSKVCYYDAHNINKVYFSDIHVSSKLNASYNLKINKLYDTSILIGIQKIKFIILNGTYQYYTKPDKLYFSLYNYYNLGG